MRRVGDGHFIPGEVGRGWPRLEEVGRGHWWDGHTGGTVTLEKGMHRMPNF